MRHFLRRLKAKSKPFRSRRIPAPNGLAVRDSVEGIVDLAGGEMLRVERQHLRSRKFLRIKSAPPFGVLESGGADPPSHCGTIQERRRRIHWMKRGGPGTGGD